MTLSTPSAALRPGLLHAAAEWRARLEAVDAKEADFVAFTTWLEARPEHRAAFNQLDDVLSEVDAHKADLATQIPADNVVVFSLWKRPVLRRAAAIGALAASVLIAFIVTRPAPETTYATATGEHRDVTLADGSVIHLNTATKVVAAFGHGTRAVRLENGEALFEVTPDPSRPFTVAVGDQHIEVVGTAFNVLRHEGAVAITVSHGVVRATAPGAEPARLVAGDQYLRREGQAGFTVAKVDAAATVAWREGRLDYDNAELSKVVSDLNRNFGLQLMLADPSLGKLRFSGVLKLDSAEAVARRLEGFLPIAAEPRGNGIVLRAR